MASVETTRQTNRKVVEALEAAEAAGERASQSWLALMTHLAEVNVVTRLHGDLMDDSASLQSRLDEFRDHLNRRLHAERDGGDLR
ncbi:hypothetical protein [Myceligenerans salitolerans]|uniref:Uncharacterized protein n=1 Tax=Myceligenerans salitolerans TaxID=1230528 RepID=A0ABS3I8L0_9MICO|nr:hypothetical protein [Myceligenerans salitolerans]MBO0609355.1 hypothetical protein [Myceligenerans salitolerans]